MVPHHDEPVLPPPGDAAAARLAMARIAAPFDRSRHRPWPQVEAFLAGIDEGPVLDLAAGNARHAELVTSRGRLAVALDVSRAVLALARQRVPAVAAVEGDLARLPFPTAAFRAAVFIAGLHCVRGRPERVAALRELARVLRPGAPALVSVWTQDQDRFRAAVAAQREHIEALRSAHARQGLAGPPPEVGDVDVPWAHDVPEPVSRFFHLYAPAELGQDLADAGFDVVSIDEATLTRSARPDNLFAHIRRR